MAPLVFRNARVAGAATFIGLASTVGVAWVSGPKADEMIDPPVKAGKSIKGATPARKPASTPGSAAGDIRSPRSSGVDGASPPAAAGPADGAPAPSGMAERPLVTDPRIDKLMEGARKAWESIGQKAGETSASGNTRSVEPRGVEARAAATDLDELRATFKRPDAAKQLPPADAVAMLGARLFQERKLSADHKSSCATCHDPANSFGDGRIKSAGRPEAMRRNTPSLWNAGFAKVFGWNAGATSLEAQVKAEIEREGGMDATLEAGAVWLSRDESYATAFRTAFGRPDALTPESIAIALAAYVKTLVSPPTRFDRWTEGEASALSNEEIEGFRLFAGKAGCAACHNGWRFTDEAARSSAGRAVRTPGLREAVWSGPYMSDGRIKTLEAAAVHMLPKGQRLAPTERGALILFLKSLSSPQRPVAPVR